MLGQFLSARVIDCYSLVHKPFLLLKRVGTLSSDIQYLAQVSGASQGL